MLRFLLQMFGLLTVMPKQGTQGVSIMTDAFASLYNNMLKYNMINENPLVETINITFQVKACKQARIILTETCETLRPSYEIIIDKDNAYSRIRFCTVHPCVGGIYKENSSVHGLLDCFSFRSFWISWKEEISFGTGTQIGTNTVLTQSIQPDTDIKYIGLQTITGISDEWMFNEDKLPFTISLDKCQTLTTTTTEDTTYLSTDPTSVTTTDATTQLSTDQSTVAVVPTTLQCQCPCQSIPQNPWSYIYNLNLTFEEIKAELQQELLLLKERIQVDQKMTGLYNSTKISATDSRLSARVTGWFGGILLLVTFGIIITFDIIRIFS